MTLLEIAEQLRDAKESAILVYAFNATGKTRLSVAYKDATKTDDINHTGVYYNAFSEDLFVWDNDNDNSEQDIRLTIKYCSLNQFHSSLKEQDIRQKLVPYKPKYEFYFNPNADPERGIDSITFYIEGEDAEDDSKTPIKISRGEERMFVWCFFLALFEVDGWADKQAAHFFIDDPVSSLDDHNIFITADTIYQLILRNLDKRKIIVTSHHFGMMSILSDWLSKGEAASRFKNRDGTKKYKQFLLEQRAEGLVLIKPDKGVMLYHLRLLQLLNEADTKDEVSTYHFALLRQVLENIASFLGVGRFSYVLEQIGISKGQRVEDIVNALSHQKVYYYQTPTPRPDEVVIFREVLKGLKDTYQFVLHT
ncbi:anticodon nuclease [Hymenobacter frigidus]|uniref:Anticodon nuclease n=1 Tax=Hymenobacter frigidus TaxID=1524095 RepID=A0ABQ1ZYS9_9BACT|nr:AAA family ATPase [Hymenobacter frigidus]GGH80883.1 anticodon nuclease [Hymenobacter frigidus]